MRVLLGCEFSGVVRDAFTALGHYAVSCDLLASEQSAGLHRQEDLFGGILEEGWDLLIFFWPCTNMAVSGARWFHEKRVGQTADVAAFTRLATYPGIPRIAGENPIGVLSTRFRRPDQIIQPWQFGHGETKATCLWLKGLPKLMPTRIVDGRVARVHLEPPGPNRRKNRSRTYAGIAAAMAGQWGSL